MRDIVFRKVERAPSQVQAPLADSKPEVKPITVAESTPQQLRRVHISEPELTTAERFVFSTFRTLSSLGSTLIHITGGHATDELEIRTPKEESAPQPKIPRAPKQAVSRKKKAAQASGRTRKTRTTAKVLALALLLAMSGINYWQSTKALETARLSNTTQLAGAPTIRQYLPNIANSKASAPLSTEDLTRASSKNKLHAWAAPWNIQALEQHKDLYTSISAFWLSLESDGNTVVPKATWNDWQQFRSTLKNSITYLTVDADPNFSLLALTDSEIQGKLIANLLEVVREQKASGIDINFEALGEENRDLFTNFIRNLTAAFRSEELRVAVTLEARLANQVPMDWRNLSLIADELRIMVYDYHARSTSVPGPIAPLGWLKEILDYTTQTARSEKVIVGLGNYGYDWIEPLEPGEAWQGLGISHERAVALASEKSTPIVQRSGIDERGYDIGTAPMFTYSDEQGRRHEVWFEDQASLSAKIDLIAQYKTAGIIFWSVGLGDTQFWTKQYQEYTSQN